MNWLLTRPLTFEADFYSMKDFVIKTRNYASYLHNSFYIFLFAAIQRNIFYIFTGFFSAQLKEVQGLIGR